MEFNERVNAFIKKYYKKNYDKERIGIIPIICTKKVIKNLLNL